jgi:hypothetical protein
MRFSADTEVQKARSALLDAETALKAARTSTLQQIDHGIDRVGVQLVR